MHNRIKKLVYISIFASLAITLHVFESYLVVPLPYGIKLGFANIVALVVMEVMSVKDMFLINFLRVVLSGMIRGTIFHYTWFISCGGVLCSSIAMAIVKKVWKLPLVSLSIIGALFHGIGQVIVVVYLYQNVFVSYILILIMITSIPTGIFTGLCANSIVSYLQKHHFYGK